MKNLPDRIYLNLGDLTEQEFEELSFDELSEVTWCADNVQGRNVEYVRKDAQVIELFGMKLKITPRGSEGCLRCALRDICRLVLSPYPCMDSKCKCDRCFERI